MVPDCYLSTTQLHLHLANILSCLFTEKSIFWTLYKQKNMGFNLYVHLRRLKEHIWYMHDYNTVFKDCCKHQCGSTGLDWSVERMPSSLRSKENITSEDREQQGCLGLAEPWGWSQLELSQCGFLGWVVSPTPLFPSFYTRLKDRSLACSCCAKKSQRSLQVGLCIVMLWMRGRQDKFHYIVLASSGRLGGRSSLVITVSTSSLGDCNCTWLGGE